MSDYQCPLEVEQIQELLLHRYPFLLLDRVLEFSNEPEPWVTAIKNVTVNEPFFQGHFPGHPVMPGVLVIESMAQAAGVLMHLSDNSSNDSADIYYLVKVDNARFTKTVIPGDQLLLKVILKRFMRGMALYECTATVEGTKVASANIMCANPAPRKSGT
jgi:3-hydroxyacyl-[acyl-carrier-protein] dehydratase